jgi:Ni/Fe-hydrogenase 1 B-type cytochrome subunit
MLEIRYVWEWPVRITHWINFFCLVVLSVTGYYIGTPFITATSIDSHIMGWNRFIHFSFAYLFTFSVLSRFIWFFLGNRHASWRAFVPWSSRSGRRRAVQMFRYYTFVDRTIPYEVGHNALAAIAYSLIFLMFLLQILTGFALYSQFDQGGVFYRIFSPVLALYSNQNLRFAHHFIMWLLLGFVIHHVYSAWLMDVKERNGTISSIFGGYKFIEPDDLE